MPDANPVTGLPFRVQPLADHGLIFTFGDRIDAGLSRRIASLTDALADDGPPGVLDLVPSYTTLLIVLQPGLADAAGILSHVNHQWRGIGVEPDAHNAARELVIPVAYGGKSGPDLLDLARINGLAPEDVIQRHVGASYQVGAIGFSPGFAFLIGLPPELATPRRSTPRTVVPTGSIGIGGAQTGIYSLPTPGGWNLIGRTTVTLFDPECEPSSLLTVGDSVRFEPVAESRVSARPVAAPVDPGVRSHFRDAIEVLEPGLQTSVQDLGRPGYGRLGVAPGGAVDRGALIAGNRLLGNADHAAGLECTLRGPRLRFLRPGRIALTGAGLGARVNGLRVPSGAVRAVGPGDELAFERGKGSGARAYLCIAGGIDVPIRLGSRATDLMAVFGGFHGRALRCGDRLRVGLRDVREDLDPALSLSNGSSPMLPRAGLPPVGQDLEPALSLSNGSSRGGKVFRVVRGPQADRFDDHAWFLFTTRGFAVSAQSNRLGIRLDGPPIVPVGGADIISEGIVTGAIQITGQGQPIVMLPSRATIGGYPKIATVIAADLDRLGQLQPGDTIRFEEATYASNIVIPRNEES